MLTICNLRKLPRCGAAIFLIALATCASGLKDTVVTEENQAEVSERVKEELSYEEVLLLNSYAARMEPAWEEGEVPVGKSIGEMIEAQRTFEEGDQVGGSDRAGSQVDDAPSGIPGDQPAEASRLVRDKPKEQTGSGTRAAVSEPVPPALPPATAVVPAGTVLDVRLQNYLSTKTNQAGETFATHLEEDLIIGGELLAPEGSRVTGRLTHVKKSGKVKGRAQMKLTTQAIFVGDEHYPLKSNTLEYEAAGTKKEDAKKTGIAAGAGAIIGAIAGGKKGAAVGTAVGAGAGAGMVLLTSGDEVQFDTEHLFTFTLERDVEMKIVRSQ